MQHGERRLGAAQRLDLRFLINAQDDGRLGWVEVEPDDVVDLVDEQGVGGEFESVGAVGLKFEGLPDAADG